MCIQKTNPDTHPLAEYVLIFFDLVTKKNSNNNNISKFEMQTRDWKNQTPDDEIEFEISNKTITDDQIVFGISMEIDDPDSLVLFFNPYVKNTHNFQYLFQSISQQVFGTSINNVKKWNNLPLSKNQTAELTFNLIIQETKDHVVDFLADDVTYRDTLTHVTRLQNKPSLAPEENIEYYLGKDNFKNLFFAGKIPNTWDIPCRTKGLLAKSLSSTIVTSKENVTYCFNNLGYRSNFDYTDETLKDKKIILCLGDSDLFGAGLHYNELWSTNLQNLLGIDYTVMNMGIRGASVDAVSRVGVSTIEYLKTNISGVLVHWPHTSLREFVSKLYKGGVHTHRNYDLPYADWWEHIDWQSNNYNFFKNKILLENTCSRYNIDFFDLTINRKDTNVPYDFKEFGIYSSIGPATQSAVAMYFYKKLTKQPSLFEELKTPQL